MKKVNVIVIDKKTLELSENANKGDIIDLEEIQEIDFSYLEKIIDEGKDKIYQEKISEAKKSITLEKQNEIDKLKSEINNLKNQSASELKNKETEIKYLYEKNIADLNNEIEKLKKQNENELRLQKEENKTLLEKALRDEQSKYNELQQRYKVLESNKTSEIEKVKLEADSKYKDKISSLENTITLNKTSSENEIEKLKLRLEKEKIDELNKQKDKYESDLRSKEETINNLQRSKASLNVKQTGEDLEAWCDNEVNQYMQNGLFNCTWTKDNKVVKEEDELKGSKADYIFKVYASEKHQDNELLASICLDMKDENPDSVNKKTNADYYKQLDKNRIKKECKYAVLVSNLEMDKPNLLPIFKVREYENMYVVRPAYLMTFLNMIVSLTTRFSDLVLSKEAERIELKDKFDLIEEFNSIKKTYLDNPLSLLETSINSIIANSESIKKVCKKIDDECEKINRSYIKQINDKISRFSLNLDKEIIKKL